MLKWTSTIALSALLFLVVQTAAADTPAAGTGNPVPPANGGSAGAGTGGSTEMVNPDLTGHGTGTQGGGTGAAPAGGGKVVVTPSPVGGSKGKAEKPPEKCPYTDVRSVKEAWVTAWRLVGQRLTQLPTGGTSVTLVWQRTWVRRADVFHCRLPKGHAGKHAGDVQKDELVVEIITVEVQAASGGSAKPGPHWTDGFPQK